MHQYEYQKLHETKPHSDTQFPYNTYLCTIPLDFPQVSAHWHDDLEIIVIKNGTGIVSVDMKSEIVHAEDIILIRPGQIHSISQFEDHAMEYENILFGKELLYSKTSDSRTTKYFEPFFKLRYELDWLYSTKCDYHFALMASINSIDELCSSKPAYYELALKSRLFDFFYILFSCQNAPTQTSPNRSIEKIKEIITFVSTHYQEAVTVDDISEYIGFSTSHFMKFFKLHMQMTFTEYLNDYRLSIAERLLLTTDLSVLSIATEVGFNNLSYFNRLFKKQFDCTPLSYRKSR